MSVRRDPKSTFVTSVRNRFPATLANGAPVCPPRKNRDP